MHYLTSIVAYFVSFQYVDALKSTIHDNLKQLVHAPSVQFVDIKDNFLETFEMEGDSEEEEEE